VGEVEDLEIVEEGGFFENGEGCFGEFD